MNTTTRKAKAGAGGKTAAVDLPASSASSCITTSKPSSSLSSSSFQKEDHFASLLKKRKAERIENATNSSSSNVVDSGIVVKAKLFDLKVKVADVKIKEEHAASTTVGAGGVATPPGKVSFTRVEWTEYFILSDDDSENSETVVGVSIINLYGLKDEVLGYKAMNNGDMMYWPARMFYQPIINSILIAAGATAGGEFLKNAAGKPMIIMSRLADTGVKSHF